MVNCGPLTVWLTSEWVALLLKRFSLMTAGAKCVAGVIAPMPLGIPIKQKPYEVTGLFFFLYASQTYS